MCIINLLHSEISFEFILYFKYRFYKIVSISYDTQKIFILTNPCHARPQKIIRDEFYVLSCKKITTRNRPINDAMQCD